MLYFALKVSHQAQEVGDADSVMLRQHGLRRSCDLAQDVTHADLDIADGGAASAVFYRIMADPTLPPATCKSVRGIVAHATP